MRKLNRVIFLHGMAIICFLQTSYAQKPCIDIHDDKLKYWPELNNGYQISNNGKYAAYSVQNQSLDGKTTFVRSLKFTWEKRFINADNVLFPGNNRYYIVFKKDTVFYGLLGANEIVSLPVFSAEPYELNKRCMLLYKPKGDNSLHIRDLESEGEVSYENLENYVFDQSSGQLVLERKNGDSIQFEKADILLHHTTSIWSGSHVFGSLVFDHSGTQVAFFTKDLSNNLSVNVVGKAGTANVKCGLPIDDTLAYIELIGFNRENNRLFFKVITPAKITGQNTGLADVEIWSTKDNALQSLQANKVHETSKSFFALDIAGQHIIPLAKQYLNMLSNPSESNNSPGDWLLVNETATIGQIDAYDDQWNKRDRSSIYLVSTVNATKRLIADNLIHSATGSYQLSPDERYVVYYEPLNKQYYSYEIATGKRRNLTKSIRTIWTTFARDDEPQSIVNNRMGYLGWWNDGSFVLVYDQNDIWALDLSGNKAPDNLTNSYGKKHHIQFRLAMDNPEDNDLELQKGQSLILKAFSHSTKEDGFFKIVPGKKVDPEKLTMQPYVFSGSSEGDHASDQIDGANLVKARDTDVYLVKRMSAKDSPNLFISTDLKHFKAITDIHPAQNYNWLTSELISYPTSDGKTSQAILYKPENFNSRKKYPVIFYYYERMSDGLNAFIEPVSQGNMLNIPYFVSNDYLVCLPDIHYTIGYPGKSALRSVEGAANYLAKRPYVDVKHMGIQGHSFGGFETEYIVAHRHCFAAACATSGWSDFLDAYNFIREGGASRQYYYEMLRERIGATPWQRPDLYLENTPVLNANQVTTPLLMMNNKNDRDVAFYMGIEYFTALRRLGKTAWMLQYNKGGHSLGDDRDKEDLDIRMKQFFDHYLKNAPPPVWMTRGVPAARKTEDSGLEIDTTGMLP